MDKTEDTGNKERGFKVDDRRRFSTEGELKPEHRGTEEKRAPEEKPASAHAGASPGPAARPHAATPPAEIAFSTFIVGLSTQVLVHLGEICDSVTEQPARDLPAAQQLIDILGMLQEKTRGNLAAEEQRLLEAILFDLRMKYVEIARQAAR